MTNRRRTCGAFGPSDADPINEPHRRECDGLGRRAAADQQVAELITTIHADSGGPTAAGHIAACASGTRSSNRSSPLFGVLQTIAAMTITSNGSDGKVDLLDSSTGGVDLVLDLFGHFSAS